MKKNRLVVLFVVCAFYAQAQTQVERGLGLGYTHAHGNDEIRMYYGRQKGKNTFQVGLETLLNPRGEAKKTMTFEGKRFSYDSLDRVGIYGRYMRDFRVEKHRFNPYLAVESQFAPTSMRLNLLDKDGQYKELAIQGIYYWDNYLVLGTKIHLGEHFYLQLDTGYGLVWILGIGQEHNFVTKSGYKIDNAFYSNISFVYAFNRWN